jgi:uncharacterized protein
LWSGGRCGPTSRFFGRDAAFRFIAGQLAQFSSVNIVGERRLGKTSLLNHLLAHQDTHLPAQPDLPPLLLARIDLQAGVTDAQRFYGAALHRLLGLLPGDPGAEARELADLRARLETHPAADYDQFRRTLGRLRDAEGIRARPVLVVDEFERLLDGGFPYPAFFDGARALITADLLAVVVASRRPLHEYFGDPPRPSSLTSSFPTYFVPYELPLLAPAEVDALLLQPSDQPPTLSEVEEARRWAGGHPCHAQAAGQALYETKAEGYAAAWLHERRAKIKAQNCMVGTPAPLRPARCAGWLRRALRALFWSAPLAIGRLAQRLGAQLSDMAAWIIGAALIVVLVLLALRLATAADVLDLVRKGLGL